MRGVWYLLSLFSCFLLVNWTIGKETIYKKAAGQVSDREAQRRPDKRYGNYLKNTQWVADAIVGLNPDTKRYRLQKFQRRIKWVGNNITFTDSSGFVSRYISWCGNDYFTKVDGTYQFIDSAKIQIDVASISYSGEWTKPTEYRKSNPITFSISRIADTLFLIKQD